MHLGSYSSSETCRRMHFHYIPGVCKTLNTEINGGHLVLFAYNWDRVKYGGVSPLHAEKCQILHIMEIYSGSIFGGIQRYHYSVKIYVPLYIPHCLWKFIQSQPHWPD